MGGFPQQKFPKASISLSVPIMPTPTKWQLVKGFLRKSWFKREFASLASQNHGSPTWFHLRDSNLFVGPEDGLKLTEKSNSLRQRSLTKDFRGLGYHGSCSDSFFLQYLSSKIQKSCSFYSFFQVPPEQEMAKVIVSLVHFFLWRVFAKVSFFLGGGV